MSVLRIQNALAYTLPEIEALVTRAFDAVDALPAPPVALAELRRHATHPGLVVLVHREGDGYDGLVIATLPLTRLTDAASVYHLFVESPKARRVMTEELVALLRDLGVGAMETLSLNGQDAAFERLFRRAAPVSQRGTWFRFDLSGGV